MTTTTIRSTCVQAKDNDVDVDIDVDDDTLKLSSTSPSIATPRVADSARRIFVGKLGVNNDNPHLPPPTADDLKDYFSKTYGPIDWMHHIPGKFSFLRFENEASAQAALMDSKYYVRPATDIKKKDNDKKRNQSLSEESSPYQFVSFLRQDEFDSSTNLLVLQCNKSHLQRLQEYLCEDKKQSTNNYQISKEQMEPIPRIPKHKTISLLLIKPETQQSLDAMATNLAQDEFLKNAVNSIFVVANHLLVVPNTETNTPAWKKTNKTEDVTSSSSPSSSSLSFIATRLRTQLQSFATGMDVVDGNVDNGTPQKRSFKLHVFPSSLETHLGLELNKNKLGVEAEEEEEKDYFVLAPTNYTHVLSVIQLDNRHYLTGISSLTTSTSVFSTNGHSNHRRTVYEQPIISRAYYKLHEAIQRYPFLPTEQESSLLHDKVALDCGAAPGGWTQYLIQHANCKLVYSIDAGSLDPSLITNPKVRYMRMTYQQAFQQLMQEEGGHHQQQPPIQADILVSDMCLHSLSQQSMELLHAAQPLLISGALIVLTFKCTTGHCAATHDLQVAELVGQLKAAFLLSDVAVIHLLANRNSERTLICRLEK